MILLPDAKVHVSCRLKSNPRNLVGLTESLLSGNKKVAATLDGPRAKWEVIICCMNLITKP